MAYLKPDTLIFIVNNGKPITCFIKKVAFRRYLANVTDKKTGKKQKKRKSMPYAICEVKVSADPKVIVGAKFTIAGYQLRNVVMKGEKILTFDQKYVVDFADQYGNEWVQKLINQEYKLEK
mgnify:CR=1 FL=1|tara:strand:+ start:240 stop:602 length:363 start_codon:yes stop_codon:yes gene_type:complete